MLGKWFALVVSAALSFWKVFCVTMTAAAADETRVLSQIRHVCLDMDGTIYKGSELFPYTPAFLALMDELGIGYTFLTNNSSKSVEAYVQHLHKMGVEATRERMYTSSLATIDFMKLEYPDVKRVFILGTPSLKDEFAAHGYTVVEGDIEPDGVVVGFDTGLDYERLCRCAWWISKGMPYIATHPDYTCPTNLPTILVDCGAVCACLEQATGRRPDAVPGKPDARMLQGILRREGLEPHQMAMVGDRLMTDIVLAQNTGAVGVLVLTGEATAEDADAAERRPDFVLESIEVLGQKLAAARG